MIELLSSLAKLFSSPKDVDTVITKQCWTTHYECALVVTKGDNEKRWNLGLRVNGAKLDVSGREPDVDLLNHPCYTTVIKPWLKGDDFVLLSDRGFYHFDTDTFYPTIMSALEEQGQHMDSMNMDELEHLVNELTDNRQPETEIGIFAKQYAETIKSQIDNSKVIVDDFFTRG